DARAEQPEDDRHHVALLLGGVAVGLDPAVGVPPLGALFALWSEDAAAPLQWVGVRPGHVRDDHGLIGDAGRAAGWADGCAGREGDRAPLAGEGLSRRGLAVLRCLVQALAELREFALVDVGHVVCPPYRVLRR